MADARTEGGSRIIDVGPIRLACMDPGARDCLDQAIEQWNAHLETRRQQGIEPPDDPVYAFAYWLMRWSGLVVPSFSLAPG